MTASFDLNVLPLYRIKGQESLDIPGLLVIPAPKHTARGREGETLLLYLTFSGQIRFTSAEYNNFIYKTAQRFHQSPGSLTFALRNAVEEINQFLLNHNLKASGRGDLIIGRLTLGVMRDNKFIFAQCGQMNVFHLSEGEIRQIQTDQSAGRGLGISQEMALHFAQVELHPSDFLVMGSNLQPGWDSALSGTAKASFELLRRKFLGTSSNDLNLVLMQARTGKGKISILRGMHATGQKPVSLEQAIPPHSSGGTGQAGQGRISGLPSVPIALQKTSPEPEADKRLSAMPTSQVESEGPANRFIRILSDEAQPGAPESLSAQDVSLKSAASPTPLSGQADRAAQVRPSQPSQVSTTSPEPHSREGAGRFVSTPTSTDIPEIKRPVSRRRRAVYGGLARVIQGTRGGTQKVSRGIRKFLPNLFPEAGERANEAGPSLALFTIIIPVIIVAIGATVYFQYGRVAQYQQYYGLALTQASQARDQKTPSDIRHAWESTIYYLDLAEKNQKTQDSTTLRQEAQTALDNLDGIVRLDFRPAIIGNLSPTIKISAMSAVENDLYLLDSASGSVIHASKTTDGYTVDTSFKCTPGQYGTIQVESLVDLGALPQNNVNHARVMAMDGKGNLLYCGISDPVAASLLPPGLGWKSIATFSMDAQGKNLYVLDPAGNAIWQYFGTSGQFPDLPTMFFGDQVPQSMSSAIDITANDSDLYILFQDGHVTSCPLSRIIGVPVRCADPTKFIDTRPERQTGEKINDAVFSELTFASIPDPSLYMLEPLTRAVYRFSTRPDSLELRGQFRASAEQSKTFSGPATAMTISADRDAFLSVGNQVYFATDVP